MLETNAQRLTRVSEGQNHRCAYCSHDMILPNGTKIQPLPHKMATKEHVIVWSESSDDSDDNIVASCNLCNLLRNNMSFNDFLIIVSYMQRDEIFRTSWHNLDKVGTRMLSRVIRTEELYRKAPNCKQTAYRYVDRHARLQSVLYREPWSTYALEAAEEPIYVGGLNSDVASIRAVALRFHITENNLPAI